MNDIAVRASVLDATVTVEVWGIQNPRGGMVRLTFNRASEVDALIVELVLARNLVFVYPSLAVVEVHHE